MACITFSCWKRIRFRYRSMKFLPCARKMSATSTVGRLTLPFLVGGWALRRVPKWGELQWDCARPVCDVERDEDRSSLLPNRHDRAKPEWFSNRSHVQEGVWPNCVGANVEIPFFEYRHVWPLR